MKDEIMKSFIELAFTVMSAVITIVLLPAVAAWLKSKTENEQIKSIITDISSAVATCVDHSEQTLVATLKSEDKWDKAAQNEVLNAVKKNVIDSLLETTKATVAENGIDIEQLVTQHIEAYIQSKKDVAKNETPALEEISH
jgi:hypothetical protein